MKHFIVITLLLLSIAAVPKTDKVSSCADFDMLLNDQGISRPEAYEYFMALEGTPAYSGDPIPEKERFWEFEGLLYDFWGILGG